jgi:hypothetical protein
MNKFDNLRSQLPNLEKPYRFAITETVESIGIVKVLEILTLIKETNHFYPESNRSRGKVVYKDKIYFWKIKLITDKDDFQWTVLFLFQEGEPFREFMIDW